MEHPVRVAFCPIFFGANGGRFNERGLPIFNDPDDDGESVRGKCDTPFDCGQCPHLQKWVEGLISQGWEVSWECVRCINETKPPKGSGVVRFLPGYYQSGRVPDINPLPSIQEFDNVDQDQPGLAGCTRCGWQSSFLQLVLRRAQRVP